ncbi:hypothetical protein K449DRAFT_421966 [Hypoxylon sp. EC38]|nr:hypothetical protein K449DRAFT_421966 [Hypoxylon sp. EC38]
MPQKDVAASFTNYLRKASRLRCPMSGCGDEFPDIDDRIRTHLKSRHPDLLKSKSIELVVQNIRRGDIPRSTTATAVEVASYTPLEHPLPEGGEVSPYYKRRKSPVSSIKGRPRSASPLRCSRARAQKAPTDDDPDFQRVPQLGKLWNPDDSPSPSSSRSKQSSKSLRNFSRPQCEPEIAVETEPTRQPEARQISQEQLVAEVKGIYAGLVMAESKCIEVDNAYSKQNETHQLSNEQWQALIALHRTLLHEHHDFFLASQHPSASPALRRLASTYAMPARMWRHGIHSFLELLRHRLPDSLEHMLTFIYLAYSMMALLYETVPAFEDTWIECLGDLGRYRMAIEDDDIKDREIWTSVSRHWYSKASDKAPTTGRLYHHLAILARPNPLQQLYYYTKSLCAPIPFISARESIMTLFNPIIDQTNPPKQVIDLDFVNARSILLNNPSIRLPTIEDTLKARPGIGVDGEVGRTAWLAHCIRSTKKWLCHDAVLRGFCTKLGSFVRSLHPLLLASIVSHLPMASASPTQRIPNIQEVKPHDPLAFIIVWYTFLLGAIGGYIVLSIYHRDKWSFLGLGMGVSAWAYLIMVLVGDVPLDVIVSAGIVCAVFTSMWTSYDLHESGMRKSRQQLAKYCIVFGAVLLDVSIGLILAPTSDPLLGGQTPPSPGLMMAVLIVPCATLSVVLCKMVRTVGDILAEPDPQFAVYLAPNQ